MFRFVPCTPASLLVKVSIFYSIAVDNKDDSIINVVYHALNDCSNVNILIDNLREELRIVAHSPVTLEAPGPRGAETNSADYETKANYKR